MSALLMFVSNRKKQRQIWAYSKQRSVCASEAVSFCAARIWVWQRIRSSCWAEHAGLAGLTARAGGCLGGMWRVRWINGQGSGYLRSRSIAGTSLKTHRLCRIPYRAPCTVFLFYILLSVWPRMIILFWLVHLLQRRYIDINICIYKGIFETITSYQFTCVYPETN